MRLRITRLLRTIKAAPRKPIGTREIRHEDGRYFEYVKTARGWVRTGSTVAFGAHATLTADVSAYNEGMRKAILRDF